MQLASWNFKSIALTFAVIGAVIGAVVAFRIPSEYQSTSVMRITSEGPAQADAQNDVTKRINKIEQEVLSRNSLTGLITGLGLYKTQRGKLPFEDIVQDMRNHDIQIRPIHEVGGHWQDTVAFSISTTNPDPKLAQAMNRELIGKFTEQNVEVQRGGDRRMGENLEVLDPASLPARPIFPNRAQFAFAGLCAGLVAGLTVAYALRWRIVIERRPA